MKFPPIIIGGCPRSGTTLLRAMIDSHKNIYSGPELAITMQASKAVIETWERIGERLQTSFELNEDTILLAYGKAIEYVYEDILAKSTHKERIADKMPQSVQHFSQLSFMLPEARFIHIIRDGRDVACSLLNRDDFFGPDGKLMSFCKDSTEGAKYWKWMVQRGQQLKSENHPNKDRYYEIFYEDLVNHPEKEMRNLLDFLDEEWDENVLKHYELEHNIEQSFQDTVMSLPHTKSIGRWKNDLNRQQKKEFFKESGEFLYELGYINELR